MLKKSFKYIIIGAILLLVVAGVIIGSKEEETYELPRYAIGDVNYDIIVEIKGEVLRPAIYTLPDGTRLNELINLAGGFTRLADSSSVNMAQTLSDGLVINIPNLDVEETNNKDKININEATISSLLTLSGIGEAKAQAIISYRNKNGGFKSIEDLMNVNGISQAIFDRIKESITI